ncbi:MAG: site-specific integrase [Candidatus Tectomicrobia bacterium]|uniref:Site-specific integrase n=1 Tax=Tectimicrobiota bacterium TaxID=2528274 RepID=A0A932CPD0_UNCTE|nr:site-specific integrase [Candidatus Tectomicrobia bacterium]
MGCVYKRGQVYWIYYFLEGQTYYESSHSEKEADAKRLLKKRLGEIAESRFVGPKADRVLLRELCEDLLADYQINGKRSRDKAQRSVRHLLDFFEESRAVEVTTDRIKAFIAQRQAQGISNAEINRELAALKRAFNLGLQGKKIFTKPYIPMLKENNIRKGFFEHGEFLAVREALPNDLKSVITFAYITGWRKEEVLGLCWNQVDRDARTVRIDPGVTKGGEGRTVFLEGELREVIEARWKARRLDCPYVFHRRGRPIRDFRDAWESALTQAGLPGKLFHDLRRTAVRNMVRAGVPERVAMTISGHKTRSVFERYNIVSESDLKEASRRVEEYNRERMVTVSVTVLPSGRGKRKGEMG